VCGVTAIYADCRFPDIIPLNFESNPFLEADDDLGWN